MTEPLSDRGTPVLVTGGAGFIGSHVCEQLVARGHRVIVVDDLRTGKRANLSELVDAGRCELVVADVAEGLFAPLTELTRRLGPIERIVHLAAQVSVIASLDNPLVDVHVNYRGTVQVLEYARATAARKVVLASSAAVYGDAATPPVGEDAAPRPLSPYGIDKLASEHMLSCYSTVHGVPATSLRFFNVYGPRQDPTSPYSGVISVFADRAAAGRPLTIFGDGEQSRDFVYVGDVARVVCDAALGDAGDRAICNVGTGRETTVNQLARTIVELCGGRSEIVHAPARAGEILRSVAAVDRAAEVFGFRAGTRLDEGLRATLRWAGAIA
jgi:UDP-glucose 4-epimerase